MAQLSARLRLPEEPRAQLVVDLDVGRHHLEGDKTIESRVMGLEDDAHATASDLLDDTVLPYLLEHHVLSIGPWKDITLTHHALRRRGAAGPIDASREDWPG